MTFNVKIKYVKMSVFGQKIRSLREEKKLPLRKVAEFLDLDQAILSKIERGQRNATKENVVKLSAFFNVKDDELMVQWLSERIVYQTGDDDIALRAIKLAEQHVVYKKHLKLDRKKIINNIKIVLKTFPEIDRAWIYGSFARRDDNPNSDIDIAIKTSGLFSYFDLSELKYKLDNSTGKDIDIGFLDSFKPEVLKNVKPDLKLIYEKR